MHGVDRWTPLVGALLMGCTPGPLWEQAFDASSEGALSGVWGSGPEDVWIVGGWMDQAQIFHRDADGWSEAPAPELPLLSWCNGWGPDSAMAVGLGGGAASWDGNAWTPLATGTSADLWGVWGASPDDVWVVGGTVNTGPPVILHYDGATFTEVDLAPEENTRGATALFKVFGAGGRIFAVGEGGLMLAWEGAAFHAVSAGPDANQDFVSLWGPSGERMVAVGGRGNARIADFDGVRWSTQAPERTGGLNAVFMEDEDLAVVGGISGYVGTWQPSTSVLTPEEVLGSEDVHALWGDGVGTIYAVGGRFSEPLSGLAAMRTGE